MIIKHSGFDGSEVMREMERLEAKKNPDAVWKPEPIAKKASSFKSKDPLHNMIMLVGKLRDAGRVEEADRLMTKMAAYQKTAEDIHLYHAIDGGGEDLLDFAYPNDAEVAEAEEELGKIHTPQNAHKRIVDIVQKQPTGKYASPTETLLQSIASDLGIEKKADANVFLYKESVITLKSEIPDVEDGPKFELKYSGDMWYIDLSFGVMTKERVLSLNMLVGRGKPSAITFGKKWGFFKKTLNNSNFKEEVMSGAFSRGRLCEYLKEQVQKANDSLDAIYQIPHNVINELESLNPETQAGEVDKLLSRLENQNDCGWIIQNMTLATIGYSKSMFDKALSITRNLAAPFVEKHKQQEAERKAKLQEALNKAKLRMLAAKNKYDEASKLAEGWPAAQKYCRDMSTAISKYPTKPMDAATWAKTTNSTAFSAKSDQEALVKFEADAEKILARVKNWRKSASAKVTIKKNAQSGADAVPPPPKKKPQGRPAQRRGGGSGSGATSYDKWLDSVTKWQKEQDRIGSDWYKSVQALQALLVNIGETSVLDQIKKTITKKDAAKGKAFRVEEVQSDIRNTGWQQYKGAYREDGKWGPATSKSILEVKKILDLLGEDSSALDVPKSGVLGAASDTKQEKDSWGAQAQKIRQKILAFTNKYRITGLGGAAAAGTAASADTVFDRLPEKPLHVTGYIPTETGPIVLRGQNLANLKSFNSWLIGNRLVPIDQTGSFRMKVREWLVSVFDNLKKRSRHLQSEATKLKDEAKQSVANEYLNAVMALEQQFQDAVAKWLPKELAKQKKKKGQESWSLNDVASMVKVSLLELFNVDRSGAGAGAGAGASSKPGQSGEPATGTQGRTGPVNLTEEQEQNYFPIGYNIYPQSWRDQGWSGRLQIYGNSVAGNPLIEYVSFRVNVNDVRSAYDVDKAMATMMKPGPEVSLQQKLRFLNRVGARLPSGMDPRDLDPGHPKAIIIQQKFNAYLLSRIAGALRMDVIRVGQIFGQQQWAQKHKDWADSVHQNAIVWASHLQRVERMAQRAYGSDAASGRVSRFFA